MATKIEKTDPTGAEEGIPLSLIDFCKRLSETVKRPELIGGFESFERNAGRVKATEAQFRERFDAFVNRPI